MNIDDAEKELIRVLDAKVAAGQRLTASGKGYGLCALDDLGATGKRCFGWEVNESLSFMWAFDGRFDRTACREYPEHAALGDRIARRCGVR